MTPKEAFRRLFLPALGVGVATLALCLLVEGGSSVIVVLREPKHGVVLERAHTEYDPEIGWINEPNIRVDDLYGPGLYLQTNRQRFRSRREFDQRVPAGKIRAVCTGDSFTLGYGVKNDDAWCELLSARDQRLETVNLGQGGYGVDQAYLWYRRAGLPLDHDVLVFAFAATDFQRMMSGTFQGYPKPVLGVTHEKPVIERTPSRIRWLFRGVGQRLGYLRHLRFLELWHATSSEKHVADEQMMDISAGRRLALAMIDDLAAVLERRRASMLVVQLAVLDDYHPSPADDWGAFLRDELGRRRIPFLDLVPALRSETPDQVPMLFRGHYNELGNRWAADRIYDALSALPSVKAREAELGPPPATKRLADAPLELELIPRSGIRLRTNVMTDLAPLAFDGQANTRWHSGALQTGHEELLVDLGRPAAVKQVRLVLGLWGYDAGRRLVVETSDDDHLYEEVLRANGEQVMIGTVDAGDAQVLTFAEPVNARYIRIRQVDHAENYWSIAEVELYRERR